MTGIGGRRRKQLVDKSKETPGHWKFKEEALGHTQWTCHKEYGINE